MADDSSSALDRIDRAIARIEAAAAARARHDGVLNARHDALRGRVTQAIAALDALIDHKADD